MAWILVLGVLGVDLALLNWAQEEIPLAMANTSDTLEFDVSAQCDSHLQINGPNSLLVSTFFNVMASGTELQAFLIPDNGVKQEAQTYQWGFSNKNWYAILFAGPKVEAQFYCDPSATVKEMALSYYRGENFKISLGNSEILSNDELDSETTTVKTSKVKLSQDPERDQSYSAGKDTVNPYWLTFSQYMHAPKRMETAVKYNFQ